MNFLDRSNRGDSTWPILFNMGIKTLLTEPIACVTPPPPVLLYIQTSYFDEHALVTWRLHPNTAG